MEEIRLEESDLWLVGLSGYVITTNAIRVGLGWHCYHAGGFQRQNRLGLSSSIDPIKKRCTYLSEVNPAVPTYMKTTDVSDENQKWE